MHSKQSHGHDNPVKQIQCHNHKQVHAFNTKSWTRQIRLNNYSVTNGYVHSLQKHGHDKSGQTNTVSQTDSIQKAWTRQITTMSQSQADTCNQYKINQSGSNKYSITSGYMHQYKSIQKHVHDKSSQTKTVSQTDTRIRYKSMDTTKQDRARQQVKQPTM